MNIYFIGIGGISMSALAHLLQNNGHTVSGSDNVDDSNVVEKLRQVGIGVRKGHTRTDFDGVDMVVYTSAIAKDNPEMLAAIAKNIVCIERSDLLGLVSREYEKTLAVSGSHGKTTCSTLLASIMKFAGATIHIGGESQDLGGQNFLLGDREFFLTEACEYKRSFLSLNPYIGVVLNIDEDHLDYYKDIEDIKSAFLQFIKQVHSFGFVVINSDDTNSLEIAKDCGKNIITFGLASNADYYADNIELDSFGHSTFDLYEKGKYVRKINLNIAGQHNVYNALAAIATARICLVDFETISRQLAICGGADRRWQKIQSSSEADVFLDYAHHPKEISAAISLARALKPQRLILAFQPHTFTRTKELWNDFVKELSKGDVVCLCPIYSARENPIPEITSERLAQDIFSLNPHTFYCHNFERLMFQIKKHATKGDLVLILGAGDIVDIAKSL